MGMRCRSRGGVRGLPLRSPSSCTSPSPFSCCGAVRPCSQTAVAGAAVRAVAGTGSETGSGADAGPGSGGGASDMFGPTPLLVPNVPPGAPPEERRKHEVRFWIRADGRVTRIEVSPPIRDSGYRRVFMETMWNFVFSPAKTRDGRPLDYVYSIDVYP